MKLHRRSFVGLCALAVAGTFAAQPSFAQDGAADYPSKPIQFIVPYSAGGGQDQWARIVSSAASSHLGQPMNVEVRAGAGGTVGWKYLLSQPADGHTIMIGSLSPMIAVLSEPNAPMGIDDIKIVDILSDFNPQVMALPGGDFDSWDKVKAYAEKNPGKLTIGGTLAQALAAAAVFDEASLEATFIPYPGTSAAVTDMLGGHIDLAVVTPTTAVSLGEKAVPIINVGNQANSETLTKELGRDVPWAKDLGYDGVAQPRWVGVHPDTPDAIVTKLDKGIKATLDDPSVTKLITNIGEEIIYSDQQKAQATYDRLVDVIKKNLPLMQ
ncbi:Bug family tripartite tricarboxylate transporter substrate binding protein [Amorphus sp. MBR-141]